MVKPSLFTNESLDARLGALQDDLARPRIVLLYVQNLLRHGLILMIINWFHSHATSLQDLSTCHMYEQTRYEYLDTLSSPSGK